MGSKEGEERKIPIPMKLLWEIIAMLKEMQKMLGLSNASTRNKEVHQDLHETIATQ